MVLISFYLGWKFIHKQNEIEFFIDKNKFDLKRKHPDRCIEINQVFLMFDNISKIQRFKLLENLIEKIRDGWNPEEVTVGGITRNLGNIDINEENIESDWTVVYEAFQKIIVISTANEKFRRDLVPILESFLKLAKKKYNH